MLTLCFLALSACTAARPVALPTLPSATRVDVANYNQKLLHRITAPNRVAAITALVDAQRDWHLPFWETPVGSFHLTLYSGSHSVESVSYGPGWLIRGYGERPYYAALSRSDDDQLHQLLELRAEDIR